MATATHAEYLRISAEQVEHLRGVVSDAGEKAAGVPAESAAGDHVMALLAEADEDGAADVGALWGVLHYVLTGKPFDGASPGDPLSEAVMGSEHVTRKPMVALVAPDRVGTLAKALDAIDLDARLDAVDPKVVAGGDPMILKLGDDDGGLHDAVRAACADLRGFYDDAAAAECGALVVID
ncbi:DUF1877 family protein [Corynebacterium sp. 335C]